MAPPFPTLDFLARAAVARCCPVALVGDRAVPLAPRCRHPDWTDIHGIRCSPSVSAIAFAFGWSQDSHSPFALAYDRSDESIVIDADRSEPLRVDDDQSLLLDAARRALGMPTPAPVRSPLDLNDSVWLDRMLELTLGSPLGEPPPWPILASLHPLSDGCGTPEALRHRRHTHRCGWGSLHRVASEIGVDWAGLTPAGASWFDEGSFVRWLFAALPESATMLSELFELLRRSDFEQVSRTLALSGR